MQQSMALRVLAAFIAVMFLCVQFIAEEAKARSAGSFSAPRVGTPSMPRAVTPSVPKSNITTPRINAPSSSGRVTVPQGGAGVTGRISPPQNIQPNAAYQNSPYVTNGYYSPYLITAAGIYLMLFGADDDGNPVYVDMESGEKIESGLLDDLGAKAVDKLPDEFEAIQKDFSALTNIGLITLTIMMMTFAIAVVALIFVQR